MEAIEAMLTCKAVRWFKPDPIPENLLTQVLEAANCAPSPGNSQGWHFVVIRERETKQRLSDLFGPVLARRWSEEELEKSRMFRGVVDLARNLASVPAVVVVAGIPAYHEEGSAPRYLYNSMYGAVQNLLVAARSVGLGTTLTMFHEMAEDLIKEVVGMPAEAHIAALIPMGWPDENFVRVKRRPLEEIAHWDRW